VIALSIPLWQVWRTQAAGQEQQVAGGGGNPRSVNVRDLGARGDGVADDTAAIQAAVDRGGSIVFPRGVYRVTATVVVELEKSGFTSLDGGGVARVQMDSAGPAFRFLGTHGGTAAPQSVLENVWERQRTPRVVGLEIVGGHDEAVGIEAAGTMQLTLSHLVLRRLLHGVQLVDRNRNFLISDCHIYENRGVGIYYDEVNLHQSNLVGCHISYNGGGGVVIRGGEVRNVHITGCDIEANHASDGPPTANVLIDCTGGSTAEVAIVGCTIQHAHDAPDSANIRVLGKGTYRRGGETLEANWGNITIADNVLSDVQTNIDLVGARGVTITGNTIWQGFQYNLRIVDSSHLAIANNMCERNPPYGYAGPTNNGVLLSNCHDATLSGNVFHGILGGGVLLEDCRRINVAGCNIVDCEGTELRLANVSHSRVSDCLLSDEREVDKSTVLEVQGGRGNLLADNLLGGDANLDADALLRESR
jgi:parallel beta-helix repeat protein